MPPTAIALLKVFQQPKQTLYNNQKINDVDYNKNILSKPFKFNDDGVFLKPIDLKKSKKSKK